MSQDKPMGIFTGQLAEAPQLLVSGIWWNCWTLFSVLLHDRAKRKRKTMSGIRGGEGLHHPKLQSAFNYNSLFSSEKKKCFDSANTA